MLKSSFFLFLVFLLVATTVTAQELVGNTMVTQEDKEGNVISVETNPSIGFFETFSIFTEPGIVRPGQQFFFNWQYDALMSLANAKTITVVISGPDSPATYDIINLNYFSPINVGGNTVFRLSMTAPLKPGNYEYFISLKDANNNIIKDARESRNILITSASTSCPTTTYGTWTTIVESDSRTQQSRTITEFLGSSCSLKISQTYKTTCKTDYYISGTENSNKLTVSSGLKSCSKPTTAVGTTPSPTSGTTTPTKTGTAEKPSEAPVLCGITGCLSLKDNKCSAFGVVSVGECAVCDNSNGYFKTKGGKGCSFEGVPGKSIPISSEKIESATHFRLAQSFCTEQTSCSQGECIGLVALSENYKNVEELLKVIADSPLSVNELFGLGGVPKFVVKLIKESVNPTYVSDGGLCVVGEVPGNVFEKVLNDVSDTTGLSKPVIVGGLAVILLVALMPRGGRK